MTARILSVGNCSYDHGQLEQLLADQDVELAAVDSADEALAAAGHCQLVLINRVFDRTGESGLELIPRLREQHPDVPVMLISNYPDAQQAAEQAGALPGFGKSQLGDSSLATRLGELVAQRSEK